MTDHALLLVNLGSPASTSVADVRSYLNQFLMDPYVIDLPWPVRRLLVSLILIKRPQQSAHAYASIWWEQGSPLVVLSRRLQETMTREWKHGPVELAMRYGEPSIESALLRLVAQGQKRITLAPLYPQFADSTVTTVVEEARRVIRDKKLDVQLSVLQPFYDQPEYLDALVASARPHLQQDFDHLLLSFHGLPERHLEKLNPGHSLEGDCCRDATPEVAATCYRGQCLNTARAFAERMGLPDGKWSVSFQSRLGRAKWIEPYTEARLDELARQGVKKILVMCPAFVADCIETLEEIGDRGREQFREAGGEELVLVPCLNDDPQWAKALNALCERAPLAL
ncbi:ferrochelatase [Pseudomonas chlororaphis]|uniref:ferrochelatase n=1 Tax=Pseudomonas chlororaphis TaxID=587753 RepID=UPI000D0FE8DD|nr:ferrochelatase [Pseudomonas chlororaphis]AVO61157.1 ferrochelatase [Pseudomonas chlororaphis subsp. piscium]AZC53141.1 Ferrochelatase, protoheme ferro-lyase [Pseudomonas chlororaphis subsp. piscium]AZC59439.1 Ferrochelatase, protoheme ferro-lyase [Pseudomonas chlororaphis subsp. piscium]AZC71852.1 Ferrochelatase, protoheme ferro-lyase [Pseudomonas chlororaphis subsp. piscium]AZC78099.1 Ferrochelatase, protoheme ferro-lyase [Pseudomonas chlororaphis subsp. piscium]